MSDQEGEGGRIKESAARKAERKQKRRKGTSQLTKPDPKKQANQAGTVSTLNTGKGTTTPATQGGKSLNIRK